MSKLWIGTSGFTYKHWGRGIFYPEDLPSSKWFDYYAEHFPIVELNVTFYRLPAPETYKSWCERSGPGFRFFVKGSRYITHIKRLKNPVAPLKRFFQSTRALNGKMAGVLWQLPPSFKIDLPRLENFLKALQKCPTFPTVFEFRHPSWFTAEIEELFKKYEVSFCRADGPEFYLDLKIPDTAPFVYYRRHGPQPNQRYTFSYTYKAIRRDARDIVEWLRKGKDVYIFFNNDIGGHAPKDAKRLEMAIRDLLATKKDVSSTELAA